MRRSMAVWLSAMFSISLLVSGCTGEKAVKSSAEPSAQPTVEAKKPVTLKLWGGVPEESGPADVVANWNKANPDIQIQYVRYVNDDAGNTKLDTALISQSDTPDIFISYGDDRLVKRVRAGITKPLDDYIAKQNFDLDGIIGSANVKKIDGGLHYLPATKNINGVLFNKAALDEIGAKVPAAGWTWDEFAELAGKLNKGDRKGAFVNPGFDPIAEYSLTAAQPKDPYFAADGSSNFNHAAVRKGMELQKQMEDKGLTVKWADALAGKLAIQNELLTGKAAMVYGGNFLIRYVKDVKSFPRDFSVAFAPEPQFQKGTNNNIGGMGDYISINKNTPNADAAFKFISWYVTEGSMPMVAGGRLPVNKKADADKVVSLLVGDSAKLFDMDSLKSFLSAQYTFVDRTNLTALPELKKILKEETEKYVMNAQTLDQAVEAAKTRADKAIQTAKK